MGRLKGICISEKRGTEKHEVPEAEIKVDWGIEGDAHGGKWHRQISLLSDEKIQATIIFSSANYDYVLVDGEKYLNEATEGNSTFTIPVSGFDWKMPVTADTTAMSTPHEIDYSLYFDSATITEVQE